MHENLKSSLLKHFSWTAFVSRVNILELNSSNWWWVLKEKGIYTCMYELCNCEAWM